MDRGRLGATIDVMQQLSRRRARRQGGQGTSEYALLLGLVAILVIGAMMFAGGDIARTLADAGAAISSGIPSGPPPPSAPTPKPTKAPKTPKPTKAPKTPKP